MADSNTKTLDINVHHITRVEGHGNILVSVRDGVLEQCNLEITESPRYFEAMLRGKRFEQVSHLASRICGICAVAHATTSLCAVEKALGIEVSPQTELLRKLNYYGEILDSHILHVFMLVAPDLFGVGSVIPLAKSAPDVVTRVLRMKKIAGEVCAKIGGRHTHPITMIVGGFTHTPKEEDLLTLREQLETLQTDVEASIELLQGLTLPNFERDTEYLALRRQTEYTFIGGDISSSDGGTWPAERYQHVTNEFQVTHSTAKHTHNQRQSYMVGALARFNINNDRLHPKAKVAANALNLTSKCTNPFMNTIAQAVEIVHCSEVALEIIQHLLERGITCEEPVQPTRFSGEGVGACEAPRGTLYHHYVIKNGYLTDANCVIPTAQNLANIEADMQALVPKILEESPSEISHSLEMLVRAYDPCISCSTHMLEVEFV